MRKNPFERQDFFVVVVVVIVQMGEKNIVSCKLKKNEII